MFFAEDIFNLRKDRAKEIMRGLIDRKIRPRIGFGAQMRHEVVKDKEFLELMREAGFDRAMVGFESVNQASLDLCGKRQQVDEIVHAIQEFHRHKIKVHGMFVGGFDTDTPQTFRDTIRFVKKHDFDSFQIMLLTPLPGTRDWHTSGFADGSRPLVTTDWSKYDGHHIIQYPKLMTAYEANLAASKAMRDFYTIPRVLKRLVKGDIVEAIFRFEARKLVRRWFKTPENIAWFESLKEQLTPGGARFSLPKRIVIAHTATSIAFKENLDRFFNELGVRVVHSRAGLGELLSQGQVKLGDLRQRASEFLADYKILDRSSASMVIVPSDCGSQTDIRPVKIDEDAPVLVHLNTNQKASVLTQQCVQIAMQFTNDFRFAAEAFRRAMQNTPPFQPVSVS